MTIIEKLAAEKSVGHRGGLYHKLQIDLAYNSNRIEGNSLTHDQTRFIYETNTIGVNIGKDEAAIKVNDVIETVNHFRCLDYVIDTYSAPLTLDYCKELHHILKNGVVDNYAVIGEFKKEPNYVGDMETAAPAEVGEKLNKLIKYYGNTKLDLYDIAEFHVEYERIHPFYDGNGRTGRLIMLKQCLENNVLPFVIKDENKMFYYLGLKEWQTQHSDERLISVFLASQDYSESVLKYFNIAHQREAVTYSDVIKQHQANSLETPRKGPVR